MVIRGLCPLSLPPHSSPGSAIVWSFLCLFNRVSEDFSFGCSQGRTRIERLFLLRRFVLFGEITGKFKPVFFSVQRVRRLFSFAPFLFALRGVKSSENDPVEFPLLGIVADTVRGSPPDPFVSSTPFFNL